MARKQINVQRFSVVSAKSFDEVPAKLEAAIGHPDMDAFRKSMGSARTLSDLEKTVQSAVGAFLVWIFSIHIGEKRRINRQSWGFFAQGQRSGICHRISPAK